MFAPLKNQDNNKLKNGFLIALLLSILFIHLPLVYFFLFHSFENQSAQQLALNQAKQKPVMVNLQEMNFPQQIADIAKPKVQKKPQKASAQALYNSSVKQETVSRRFSKANQQFGAPPSSQQAAQKQMPDNKAQQSAQQQEPQDIRDRLKMIRNDQQQKEKQQYAKLFQNAQQQPAPTFKSSIGSPVGGYTDDYLRNYQVGDRTYLNTLANPNVGFFVELRQKFRFAFNPVPVLRPVIHQISRGQIAVVWGVSVDSNGNLKEVKMLRSSGITPYDNEALRTIRTSAPFSRPPSHLLQKDNLVHMAWTFVVYL
ncbi:MAG: energy transducer TonB [Deltaproteobacteria bacterium]|nr:energy transducer TonB [Deltaproteobacteria bacterium]